MYLPASRLCVLALAIAFAPVPVSTLLAQSGPLDIGASTSPASVAATTEAAGPTTAPPSDFDIVPSFLHRDDIRTDAPHKDSLGSTYIPVDSPIYPMALRLYSMGFLGRATISMRPWTRRNLLHMLEDCSQDIMDSGNEEAEEILAKLNAALEDETAAYGYTRGRVTGIETVYTRLMGIEGQTLRDSYHLGQTLVNDYGRPYEPGFNNVTGFSSVNEWGRFSLYVRGEYQHSPASSGYSLALANTLSCIDTICPFAPPNAPQDTIPYGAIAAQNPFRLQEATLTYHVLGHDISGGKSDAWLGPGRGAGMAWSNNAEDIYSFRINRTEPLRIPLVSDILGPVRYDFFVGSLKGHTAPNHPWVHQEVFAFRPTADFELGLQRTVIWGGAGHEAINLHTFLRSFFNFTDVSVADKNSPKDPGARFTAFNFSWRLPFLQHFVTLYTDMETHDDTTPLASPRRAIYRPGIELSQVPGLRKLEFRVEGVNSDPPVQRSMGGQFDYFENVQRQGYTNKGFIMGDWIGREGKGGQAWLTYHLSGNEWIEVEYLHKKTAKDFVPLGTTQNQFKIDVVKRLRRDIELDAWLQYEGWKAPAYIAGQNNDTVVAGQITFYPKLHTSSPSY